VLGYKHCLKVCGGIELYFRVFLTSALHWGQSTSLFGRFLSSCSHAVKGCLGSTFGFDVLRKRIRLAAAGNQTGDRPALFHLLRQLKNPASSVVIITIIIIGCFTFTPYILRDVCDMGFWYTQVHCLWTMWLQTEQSAVLLACSEALRQHLERLSTAVSAAVAMLY